MGGGSFIPKQQNWRFMQDNAAEPTVAYANENTTFSMSDNSDILRLRVTLIETGGKGVNNILLKFEWSTDNISFNTPGPASEWGYADGQATQGNLVTTNKLSDTTGKGEYVEASGGAGTFDVVASTSYEFDFAITPGSAIQGSQLYYFRFLINDAEVVLNSGETHAYCTSATVAEEHSGSASISGNGSLSGSPKKGGKGALSASAAGMLAALGMVAMLGTAAIAGNGSLAGAGIKATSIVASVSGGGSLIATGEKSEGESHSGVASISGGGATTAVGNRGASGIVSVSGNGTLAGTGTRHGYGTGGISFTGSLTGTGTKHTSDASVISGGGSLTATGFKPEEHTGVAIITGSGSLGSDGDKGALGAGSISHGDVPAEDIIMLTSGQLAKRISDTLYLEL